MTDAETLLGFENQRDASLGRARPLHLAEVVAARLRQGILSGRLSDGELLPKQDVLLKEFGVGKHVLREAMRILEAEGLVTIRRGNVGGAIVHVPGLKSAAHLLGMVLEVKGATVGDLASALRHLEPVCAGMCAGRADRHEEVVPVLSEVHSRSVAARGNELEQMERNREFHSKLVELCGNVTMTALIGTAESLWSTQESAWAHRVHANHEFPGDGLESGERAHERLIELIEAGDVEKTVDLARRHLELAQRPPLVSDEFSPIKAAPDAPRS